ncbi:ABC transporter ATP-binding protein [Mycoplasmopsis anatis]|uniref:ATP-binding protein n=1 Tax=Mycoplasmopsis anatis 1340 TaxID=1034808 RepID=F9QDA9_9BACT|nr:ABC transporter ATP-binding protein [Mycoplasmopsis anatis]AWX70036.1 ABC transporter ATP-binding protein [Mycoplasmopsis anatis]EGS29248.1 ATP-binding protein [Mycoplasmopsis anatis 1340]
MHNKKSAYKTPIQKGMFKALLKYVFKTNKIRYPLAIILNLFSSLTMILAQMFIGVIVIGKFLEPWLKDTSVQFDWKTFNLYIIAYILILIFTLVSMILSQRLMANITHNTLKSLRNELYKSIQKKPVKFFDTTKDGEVMGYFINDIELIKTMIQSIPDIVQAIFTVIVSFTFMAILSWLLAIVLVILVIFIMVVMQIIVRLSSKYFVRTQTSLGNTNAYINEMIDGLRVVKVFNHEQKSLEKFNELNQDLYNNDRISKSLSNILMPVAINMGNINYAILGLIGSILIINTTSLASYGLALSVGVLISFLQLARSFTHPISSISQNIGSILMALSGFQRVKNALDLPEEIDEGNVVSVYAYKDNNNNIIEVDQKLNDSEINVKKFWKINNNGTISYIPCSTKGIVLENVNFGYNESKEILKNINLTVKPGQKIAIVGPTGAGKTTITNLLNRFYDITSGNIYIDGINIREISKKDLREKIGVVLQDTYLFSDTVKNNISYGNPNATLEDVIRAAKVSNADSFINLMSKGYDTFLESAGANLSQGQRQLLSIARVACYNPDILILDEATSNIDTQTEKEIQKALSNLMDNKTSFIIAHRLSTVRNADLILVLKDGEINELGTHEELIKNKGLYYALYTGNLELS